MVYQSPAPLFLPILDLLGHICGSSFPRNGTILLELLASVHDFGTFAAYMAGEARFDAAAGSASASGYAGAAPGARRRSISGGTPIVGWFYKGKSDEKGDFFFSGCPPILGNLRRRMGHVSQKMF